LKNRLADRIRRDEQGGKKGIDDNIHLSSL
jgi:hypothetical protein